MKISSQLSARIANASLVAACAVVVLHTILGFKPSGSMAFVGWFLRDFARFAVPFFFLVSGFLLAGHIDEPGWWHRETLKRMRTIFVPYLLWSALFGLYLLIGVAGPAYWHGQSFDFASWWAEKNLLLFGLDLRQAPLMLPLWYLRTLLVLVILSGILVMFVRRHGILTLVILGISYLAYSVAVDIRPGLTEAGAIASLRATFSPEAFFYFTVGLWLRNRKVEPPVGRAVPCLVAAILLLVLRRLFGPVIPYPLIVPFAVFGVWSVVPGVPWPRNLTALAFAVYLFHWFFVHLAVRIAPGWGRSGLALAVVILAVTAASLAFGWVVRCSMPRLSGILFGGR